MLDRLRDEDDGFTLVETLAAMIVFAVLAVCVGGVILNTFDLTRSNTARVAASNLAQQQIEAVRQLRAIDIPDGAVQVLPKPKVNGVEYTVTRTANYVEADSSTSLCTGPSASSGVQLAYKLVTVNVTWPDMGLVDPVRQDTLLSLGIGFSGVDTAKGTAAIAVTGADGKPRSGVTVTLTPAGSVSQIFTGSDGCAVFTGLTPSTSYTASVNQPFWVDRSGAQQQTSPAFTVTASGVTRVALPYDRAGSLAMTLAGPEGLLPPAQLGVTLASSNFSTTERVFADCSTVATNPHQCVSGAPRTAAKLFPGQYGAWAGTCTDARPVTSQQAAVQSAGTATAVLPLAGVRAQVVSSSGVPVTGYTVYALHAADGVCSAHSWPMTPASSANQALALPAGTWTLALTSNGSLPAGALPWPVVTLATGQPVPTVVVRVP